MASQLHLSNPVVSRCGCVGIYVEHDRPERPTSQARPRFGVIEWNCASAPVSNEPATPQPDVGWHWNCDHCGIGSTEWGSYADRLAELATHLAACTDSDLLTRLTRGAGHER